MADVIRIKQTEWYICNMAVTDQRKDMDYYAH